VKLLCHINDDEDLLQAWLDYYMGVGVSSFHFIVHGAASENTKLFQLTKLYPIFIEDAYDDPFNGKEKRRRIEHYRDHIQAGTKTLSELRTIPLMGLSAYVTSGNIERAPRVAK
jgi:hypothetical protein